MRRHRCAGIGARADVGQQLKVEYYEIRGTSWPDLKRQIDAKGPEGWWGVTNSVTHYAVKPRLTEAGCVAEQVLVENQHGLRQWTPYHD